MDISQKWILGILSAILAAALSVTICISIRKHQTEKTVFVAPSLEEGAVSGVPDGIEETQNYQTIEIGQGFVVSLCGNLYVDEENNTEVYFTSDKENQVWTRLILLDGEGNEVASSGILKPGEYVKTISLSRVLADSEEVTAKIISYEPETYYSRGSASAKVVLQSLKNLEK